MNGTPSLASSGNTTMNSRSLLELINDARADFGEPAIRANDFAARVKDELEGEDYESFVVTNPNQTQSVVFELTHDQCMLVAMRESKGVRRSVLDRLKALSQPSLPNFNDPVSAARAWADAQERGQQLALEKQALEAECDHLKSYFFDGISVVDFGKSLNGVNVQKLQRFLADKKGWLYNEPGSGAFRATALARDKYITERVGRFVNTRTQEEITSHKMLLLREGAARLYALYMEGQLPMKKTWDGAYGHGKRLVA